MSFEAAAVRYLDHASAQLRPRTLREYGRLLAQAAGALGSEPLSALTPARLRAYIGARRGCISDIQLRMELCVVSQVLEHAIETGAPGAPEANPVRLVRTRFLARPQSHPRPIAPVVLLAILDALDARPSVLRSFVALCLETGMRHEELAGLTWDEVDLPGRAIRLGAERVKTKRGRVIPLTEAAVRTLGAQSRVPGCPYVFVNPRTGTRYKNFNEAWRRLRKRVGASYIRIHDLRHTFASHTRAMGMDRMDRQAILGHTTVNAHERYAAVDGAALRASLERHSLSTWLAHERQTRREGDGKVELDQ